MKLLARASAGLVFWAFAFMLIYALHGLGCAAGWNQVPFAGASLFRWILVASWVLLGGVAGAIILWAMRLPAGFEGKLALVAAIAGAVGILATGMPVAVMSACM